MRRIYVSVPDSLYEAVEAYRLDEGLQNWPQALVKLTANALGIEVDLPAQGGARPGAGRPTREAIIAAYTSAFEDFMSDTKAVESAIDGSTSSRLYTERETWVVELFKDGTFRVLSGKEYEDGYRSPGIVVAIPPMQDEDMPPPDAPLSEPFYGNAVDEMRRNFDEEIAAYRNA